MSHANSTQLSDQQNLFFLTFKKEINSKTNHNSDLKTLKAQVSLVNLIKTFAQAINIVFIRLMIEKICQCSIMQSPTQKINITDLLMKSTRKKSKVDTEINLRL